MSRTRVAAAIFAALIAARARAEDAPAPASEAKPAAAAPAKSSQLSAPALSGQASVHGGVIVSTRGGSGSWAADLFLNLFTLGIYAAAVNQPIEHHQEVIEDSWGHVLERHPDDGDGPPPAWEQRRIRDRYDQVRRHDAREGFLFSFGLGGGTLRVSGPGRAGALDLGLRLGYGFSDRFQLFGDFTADVGFYQYNRQITNWLVTLRGQTVLIGDTTGNGLNLNLGFGLGGTTESLGSGYGPDISSPAAPALVAGLSYDARVGRQFALSPELYFSYHEKLNPEPYANDHVWSAGLRLNFLWYSPVY